MVRVLRYPRMTGACCVGAIACALARDACLAAEISGWPLVLLVATFALLLLCFVLMSSRFFVDADGVGVGFMHRVRRTSWYDLSALGALCCNGRRMYLYGMYLGADDFLQLLHRAPQCGPWGFVVPLSRKLENAVRTACPYPLDLTRAPAAPKGLRLRPLWHQALLYQIFMIPSAAVAFLTAALMIIKASQQHSPAGASALTLGALALCAAGILLLRRAFIALTTCPRINETGIRAGFGLYLPWEDVRFGYVHRLPQSSGFFLLTQPLGVTGKRSSPPVYCLSLPDTSTLLLAYLTYCPHAPKGMGN